MEKTAKKPARPGRPRKPPAAPGPIGPRPGINFIAFVSGGYGPSEKTDFTCHKTQVAAEKKYGDLQRFYRGSSATDLELIVYSMDEVFTALDRGDITYIDWQNKVIHWG